MSLVTVQLPVLSSLPRPAVRDLIPLHPLKLDSLPATILSPSPTPPAAPSLYRSPLHNQLPLLQQQPSPTSSVTVQQPALSSLLQQVELLLIPLRLPRITWLQAIIPLPSQMPMVAPSPSRSPLHNPLPLLPLRSSPMLIAMAQPRDPSSLPQAVVRGLIPLLQLRRASPPATIPLPSPMPTVVPPIYPSPLASLGLSQPLPRLLMPPVMAAQTVPSSSRQVEERAPTPSPRPKLD